MTLFGRHIEDDTATAIKSARWAEQCKDNCAVMSARWAEQCSAVLAAGWAEQSFDLSYFIYRY